MSDDRRQSRPPVPQRSPSDLADLLAAMSDEADADRRSSSPDPAEPSADQPSAPTQPTPSAPPAQPTSPAQPSPPAQPTSPAEPAPPAQPAASPPQPAPAVSSHTQPAPAVAPSQTQPAPDQPTTAQPPAPQPPAPQPATAQPPPPQPAAVPPTAQPPASTPPPPAEAIPYESDVVAGTTIAAGVGRPAPADEPDVAGSDAPAPPRTPAQSRTRVSGRVSSRGSRSRIRTPSPPRRRGRSGRPTGRGLEPSADRGRRQRLLRFGIAVGGLIVVLVVIVAALGSPSHNHAPSPPTGLGGSATTVPAPATSTTRSSGRPHHATPSISSLPGLGGSRTTMLIAAFAPGPAWSAALAAAPSSAYVVDPADGPGRVRNPSLAREITLAQQRGGRALGLIDTHHGATPVRTAETEMADYRHWYGIDDVYLASADNGGGALAYERTLASAARAHGAALVVLKAGATPARSDFSVANVVVTFAGDRAAFLHASQPGWFGQIPADRKAVLITGASTATAARHALAVAHGRGLGVAYVTSGSGAHAFDSVPPYLIHERSWLSTGP